MTKQTFRRETRSDGLEYIMDPYYGYWVIPDAVQDPAIFLCGYSSKEDNFFMLNGFHLNGVPPYPGAPMRYYRTWWVPPTNYNYGRYQFLNKPGDLSPGLEFDQQTGLVKNAGYIWHEKARRFGPKDTVWHPDYGIFLQKGVDPVRAGYFPVGDFSPLGLKIEGFPICCGAKILSGFNSGNDISTKEYIEKLQTALTPYKDRTTGIILAILSPTQHAKYEPRLLAAGFKLLHKHPNLAHGRTHYNWLYGYVCAEQGAEKIVEEAKRAFG